MTRRTKKYIYLDLPFEGKKEKRKKKIIKVYIDLLVNVFFTIVYIW